MLAYHPSVVLLLLFFVLFVDNCMKLNDQFWLQNFVRAGKASTGAFPALTQEDL